MGDAVVPNTGVMVIRRSSSAIRLLERVWAEVRYLHHRWWENAALIEVVGGDGDVGLCTPWQRWRAGRWLGELDHRWNSVPPCPAPTPAIVHLAGVDHESRLRQMRSLVEESLPRSREM